jgi:hypothetical protein
MRLLVARSVPRRPAAHVHVIRRHVRRPTIGPRATREICEDAGAMARICVIPVGPAVLLLGMVACSSSAAEVAQTPVEDAATAEVVVSPPSAAPPVRGSSKPIEITTPVATVTPLDDPDWEFGPACHQYFKTLERCNAKVLAQVADPAGRETVQRAFADAMAATRDAWRTMKGDPALHGACLQAMQALDQNPSCTP